MGQPGFFDLSRRYEGLDAMIDLVRAATGTNKPVAQQRERFRPQKSEVRALIADARALRGATNWAPRIDLKTGIVQTAAWWRERLGKGNVRSSADYVV